MGSFSTTLTLANLLTHVGFILMHRWAVVWSKALDGLYVVSRKAHRVSEMTLAAAQHEWNVLVLQHMERKGGLGEKWYQLKCCL